MLPWTRANRSEVLGASSFHRLLLALPFSILLEFTLLGYDPMDATSQWNSISDTETSLV